VSEGAVTAVRIRPPAGGSVTLEVVAAAGTSFQGGASVECRWPNPESGGTFTTTLSFLAPPFRIVGLAPGAYEFRVTTEAGRRGSVTTDVVENSAVTARVVAE
jgi:hypothetical protein